MKKKVALLGGSFDPIHNGHLTMAQAALDHLGVDEVWFIPAGSTPLKDRPLTNAAHRLKMIRLACQENPKFKVCDIELKRNGKSYTVDTLERLTQLFPNIEFFWLIGEDQAHNFDHWKDPDRLKELATFAVAIRQEPKAQEEVASDLWENDSEEILVEESVLEEVEEKQEEKVLPMEELEEGFIALPMRPMDVSSTQIRNGKRLNMLPKPVLNYILDQELYLIWWIRSQMSPSRFAHSCSVARLCRELAKAHGLNPHAAWLAGLFHDIAKDMPKEEQEKWIRAVFPEALNEHHAIWHGYIGSEVVKRFYGLESPMIRNAIFNHVKGTSYDPYAMMVFIADKLDPLRGYDSSGLYKACLHDLYNGFLLVKAENKAFLEKEKGTSKDKAKLLSQKKE
ncbi:MAG: nicotinate (nicotinamide) nucleotide adenylyltransferase [Allobaculum sp.]|nr:nicotinate (nicotinamide) nucleotide adenylyltransferase [Allobaculum sp.]